LSLLQTCVIVTDLCRSIDFTTQFWDF